MMNTAKKLKALRVQMQAQDLDGFIVPRADEYQGEFVAPCAERLKWLTGFTGSGGVAAVLMNKAVAMTDGRYMLQIAKQVDKRHFDLCDMTKKPLALWLREKAPRSALIGYDPWLHTPAQIESYTKQGLSMCPVKSNPLDSVWLDQPESPSGDIIPFPKKIAGQSVKEKIALIAEKTRKHGAEAYILSLPDAIAWLLNIRGEDIDYIPSTLSYAIIYRDGKVQWVINPDRITKTLKSHLGRNVSALAPENLEMALMNVRGSVLLDPKYVPIWFEQTLEHHCHEVVHVDDLCMRSQAVKTKSEQDAIKAAHIKDSVALIKFMHWIEGNAVGSSEVEIAEKLESFRKENRAFKGPSFPTICGFGDNAAIIHYRANAENNAIVKGDNMLLIDSGGQYLDEDSHCAGTTDITRTIMIGEPTHEMKRYFTLVLKGHIALARAQFPAGTAGVQVDVLARAPLWAEGADYAHGTGHGVGCYLAVHENSASISPRGQMPLEVGMLLSNEPGYYKEGAFGIRTENLLLVQPAGVCKDTGMQMLCFDTISYAPIDKTLADFSMLNNDEREWLNTYHLTVYRNVAPFLDEKLEKWLKLKVEPV